jgi:hypothetical protein
MILVCWWPRWNPRGLTVEVATVCDGARIKYKLMGFVVYF